MTQAPTLRDCRRAASLRRVAVARRVGALIVREWTADQRKLVSGRILDSGWAPSWTTLIERGHTAAWDRLITELGPDWPRVREPQARPKDTDEVVECQNATSDDVHGGDGQSGECAPRPQAQPSESPDSAEAGQSGSTPSQGGGARGAGRQAEAGAGSRDSGVPASSAGGEREGHGPEATPGGGAPTASASSSPDVPRASGSVPRGLSAAGSADTLADVRAGEEGTSPASVQRSPDGEALDSILQDLSPPGSLTEGSHRGLRQSDSDSAILQDRIERAWCDAARVFEGVRTRLAGSGNQAARRWLRKMACGVVEGNATQRALVRRLVEEHGRPLRHRRHFDAHDREALGEALATVDLEAAQQIQGAPAASGRTGGSRDYLAIRAMEEHRRVLRRDRSGRRLMAALERWLDRDVGTRGEASPRLDAPRLVRELQARSGRLSRCRREELEQSTAVLAVDCSGSCAVACAETMAAALVLSEQDERLVVVEHSNGVPWAIWRCGRVERIAERIFEDDSHALAAWWRALCQRSRTTTVLWLGDSDGREVRRALGEQLQVMLFDAWSKSGGVRRAPRVSSRGQGYAVREEHCAAHIVGVSDAQSFLEALRKLRAAGA